MTSPSSHLSSLPSYNGLISRQKHSNPTTYNSNVVWWRSTLDAIVSRGWQPNTSDTFILHADQNLLESLRYEGAGKPLCLGTVIVNARPFSLRSTPTTILDASQSIYDSGWLPYRVASFVVGKPLLWALQQFNLVSSEDESDSERWKRINGDYILLSVVERAADTVLVSQRARDASLSDALYSYDSFRATFADSALPGVTLSDNDLRVLIKFLERDRRAVITEKEVIKFVQDDPRTLAVTAVDHGVLELKTAVANISTQIDSITTRSTPTAAIRQQHKSLALSYLRSRKQLEDVLAQRLGSLEILQSTLLRVESAAEDIQIVKTYESSTATLRALLAHPSIQRDALERTFDALADANADARELDETVRSNLDVALGVSTSLEDEDEIDAELAALVAEAEVEAPEKKIQRLATSEPTRPNDVLEVRVVQGRNDASAAATVPEPVLIG
ncbi:hypothetical protein B0F90DRAFT_1862978 [Multifurca ochricompacta]|uniref:Charged multivesicular body protein 7 n=1 Tax=Multifurca ochricompacta TaxID=376703 RepID=A0AAD4M9K1_9AGAM|nr:hypothetical protein B0F90DRAFT_1862978 [Multifurca ochricompacta]